MCLTEAQLTTGVGVAISKNLCRSKRSLVTEVNQLSMRSLEKTAIITRWEVRPLVWSLLVMLYLSALLPQIAVALLCLGFISFQALKEFYTMMPLRRAERSLVFVGYLCIPLQLILVGMHYDALAVAFIPFLIFALAAWLITR